MYTKVQEPEIGEGSAERPQWSMELESEGYRSSGQKGFLKGFLDALLFSLFQILEIKFCSSLIITVPLHLKMILSQHSHVNS